MSRSRQGGLAALLLALAGCRAADTHRAPENAEPPLAPSADAEPTPPARDDAAPAPAIDPANEALSAGNASAPAPVGPNAVVPDIPRTAGACLRVFEVGESVDTLGRPASGQAPNVSRVVPTVDLDRARGDFGDVSGGFLAQVSGWLDVPNSGVWTFELASDDGARFSIDGRERIANEGERPPRSARGEADLASGAHSFEIWHADDGVGGTLRLSWRAPGASDFAPVPTSALSSAADDDHATAPGAKSVVHRPVRGTPGDGLPLAGVHPSFELSRIAPDGFAPEIGGMGWLPDGRLVVCTREQQGSVFVLSGLESQDRANVQVKRFASGLAEPLGLAVVGERIFVAQEQELTELVDRDGDGIADEYRCVSSDWNAAASPGERAFGLAFRDGSLVFALASSLSADASLAQLRASERGSVLAAPLDGGSTRVVARGFCVPRGVGIGPKGELYVTDAAGDGVPAARLVRVRDGANYGSGGEPPVAWLPRGEALDHPSQPVAIASGALAGQWLVGDANVGAMQRVFVEEIDGVAQGAVFRFSRGFGGGVQRASFGPSGALAIGEASGAGLERLSSNGRPAFEMLALRALANGIEIEFTEPLALGSGWEPDAYEVRTWRCEVPASAGESKRDLQQLCVRTASVSSDRRRVFLELSGLASGRVMHVRLVGAIEAESDRPLWSSEGWLTVNRVPARTGVPSTPPQPRHNTLSEAELQLGWQLLFDGVSTRGWRGFRQTGVPAGWSVEHGALVRTGAGGDLVSALEYDDFELSLEWKISPGGNSGIFFHASEDFEHVWESGPEMQVLDSERHADGQEPRTSAGANYALHAPPFDATRPVGTYNRARIVVQGAHVEHWLNGKKLLEYELGSPDWETLVAASKFASMPGYGRTRKGRIALQDHGDRVAYRDIKIRPLSPP